MDTPQGLQKDGAPRGDQCLLRLPSHIFRTLNESSMEHGWRFCQKGCQYFFYHDQSRFQTPQLKYTRHGSRSAKETADVDMSGIL